MNWTLFLVDAREVHLDHAYFSEKGKVLSIRMNQTKSPDHRVNGGFCMHVRKLYLSQVEQESEDTHGRIERPPGGIDDAGRDNRTENSHIPPRLDHAPDRKPGVRRDALMLKTSKRPA